jgi:hypothetical protein
MKTIILNEIESLLLNNKSVLRIAIRQRAKFEQWLKFELAHRLEILDLDKVLVEAQYSDSQSRADVSAGHNGTQYSIELKTPNTNWKIEGVQSKGRPITKNIRSIIEDVFKLEGSNGIIAFVFFPIPLKDNRWRPYVQRIIDKTKAPIDFQTDCRLVELEINDYLSCNMLICVFEV